MSLNMFYLAIGLISTPFVAVFIAFIIAFVYDSNSERERVKLAEGPYFKLYKDFLVTKQYSNVNLRNEVASTFALSPPHPTLTSTLTIY
jgi:hypothetical protein